MGHTVGDAADRAVKRSEKKTAAEQTPAELINELRKNLKANLYIPSHQIAALLAAYDLDHALMVQNTKLLQLAMESDKARDEEKKTMTDTIFGLTETVQRLKAENELTEEQLAAQKAFNQAFDNGEYQKAAEIVKQASAL